MNKPTARTQDAPVVENPPGVFRRTLAFNDQTMLCHFELKQGARIPFHDHPAAQNGFLIRGKMRMLWEDGRELLAEPGTGWCFAPHERHGAEVLQDSEAVECFTPARPEYLP